jgi:hypothetical protein
MDQKTIRSTWTASEELFQPEKSTRKWRGSVSVGPEESKVLYVFCWIHCVNEIIRWRNSQLVAGETQPYVAQFLHVALRDNFRKART